MDDPRELDDEATEALVSGRGRDLDPELHELLASLHSSYTNQLPAVAPALAAIIDDPGVLASARRQLTSRPWLENAGRRFVAAAAVAFGLASGLAVADALPGPVQNAMAKVGIGDEKKSAHAGKPVGDPDSTTTPSEDQVDGSSTTTLPGATTTTAPTPANHGSEVSGVARDKQLQGCEHGRAVSGVASGKVNPKPCPTSTTTTTTVPGDGSSGGPGNGIGAPEEPGGNSGDHGRDDSTPDQDGTENGNGRPAGKGVKPAGEDVDD
jgi:hypothetical protein